MYRPYAGIGSRQTPGHILSFMTRIAEKLDTLGFTLRSGGASGADSAFEAGATRKEIYLPWRRFNGSTSPLFHVPQEALLLAAQFHPAWERCSPGARKLHARNMYQILGKNLKSPSLFVLCWTPGGSGSGGTGQAIRIARHLGVPVLDMGKYQSSGPFLDEPKKLL